MKNLASSISSRSTVTTTATICAIACGAFFASAAVAGAPTLPKGPIRNISNFFPVETTGLWDYIGQNGIATDPESGKTLITFLAGDSNNPDVQGAIISPTGARIGSIFTIASHTLANNLRGDRYNAGGASFDPVHKKFLVTWAPISDGTGVAAAIVSLSGAIVKPAYVLASNSNYGYWESAEPVWGDGQWLVTGNAVDAQTEFPSAKASQEPVGIRVSASGTRIGNDFLVANTDEGSNDSMGVAYSPKSKRYIVAWRSNTGGEVTSGQIRGQMLDGKGVPVGSVLTISDPANTNRANCPMVTFDSKRNRFGAGWCQSVGGTQKSLFRPLNASTGAPISAPVELAGYDGYNGNKVRLAYNSITDSYLSTIGDGNTELVSAQRLSASGVGIESSKTELTDSTATTKVSPTGLHSVVTALPTGQWLVMWNGLNATGTNDIFVRVVGAATTPSKPEVKWSLNKKKRLITATVTKVSGVTYKLTAKLGLKTKTGKCKTKGAKVICTLAPGRGKWTFSILPRNAPGNGKPNVKAVKL